MESTEELEEAFERIMFSEESAEDLGQELEEVYEKAGLSTVSHLYGLNCRINQFEEVFQAYREFYAVKDFRDGSRIKDRKLHDLMEAYRDYFGSGSNEQWNEGVELAEAISPASRVEGPLQREDFYEIMSGEYE